MGGEQSGEPLIERVVVDIILVRIEIFVFKFLDGVEILWGGDFSFGGFLFSVSYPFAPPARFCMGM